MHFFAALTRLALVALPILASTVTCTVTSKFVGKANSGRHIIKLKEGVDRAAHVQSLSLTESSSIMYEYSIINGFAGSFSHAELARFRADENVEYVEEDSIATIMGSESKNPWGLSRISTSSKLKNQDPAKLSFTYTYNGLGEGVDIYMVDTGILISHPAFGGRAIWGKTFGGYPNTDEEGHGTHTAGTAISNPYGVAQKSRAIAVRVLDAVGNGNTSDIVAGLEWVGTHVKSTGRRGVVSMSLGLPSGTSKSWDNVVRKLVKANIPVVIAAGNSDEDASLTSPSDVKEAIVVGATDITDTKADFSNFGANVDIFAPGVGVISTYNNGKLATLDGTSMATPHVAGQVAIYLSTHKNATSGDVTNFLKSSALSKKIAGIPSGTANLFLNNGRK